MSILSKTWRQVWLTHPNLEFEVCYHKGNMKIVDNIMERYRDGKIPIERFELLDPGSSQSFPSIDKWLDIALHNGVKHLVFKISIFSLYPLPIFKILAAKSLRELVLFGCNLKYASFSSGVASCESLRKLSLSSVGLDENMLQALLNRCSLIVNFVIMDCYGLKKIEVVNLQKIKSVYIRTSHQLVKIKAPTLEHLCFRSTSEESGELDVIDAPNLVSLEYAASQIHQLQIAKGSSQLKHSQVILHCLDNLNAEWFCKLRKFLSNSNCWPQVFLYFQKCNGIKRKDLQLHHTFTTPQVDALEFFQSFFSLRTLIPSNEPIAKTIPSELPDVESDM
ncbi:hypothetical protein HAX54_002628 [Datura stramonium]|uniref:F-box/LRR-repeat protein 15/At3g58940/PEG3-like LRR domain-containing protein n=1 Tax=Datura stramonium TaxID=4076 RepID=A0ABS8T489_DATST|nr:hypothetical protein [Datura stramonium]